METLSALLAAIPQPDVAGMARAQHIDGLLKPPGSLGRLESLAVQLAGLPGLQGQLALSDKAIVVMCADHGVWHEGVTPSPQAVTAIHAGNMVRGNTGVCVLAAQAGVRVEVVDVGIDAEPLPGLINLKVARGREYRPDGGDEPSAGGDGAAGQHAFHPPARRRRSESLWRGRAGDGQYHPGGSDDQRPDRQRPRRGGGLRGQSAAGAAGP
jgi:nicotinate-nucleotide--dimethylbenzimidazole phosphoribosyltransferase